MIKQNEYTAETIHVANWLLLSGNVDLAELAAEAARQNERELAAVARENEKLSRTDEDSDAYASGFRDCFQCELEQAIERTITVVVGKDAGNLLENCGSIDWSIPTEAETYHDADVAALIQPFIAAALDRASIYDVAQLILKHRPELRQAMQLPTIIVGQ
jgi:hypothetical protein